MQRKLCFVISEFDFSLYVCRVLIIDLRTFLSQTSSKNSCCVSLDYRYSFWCCLSTRDTFIVDCSLEFRFSLIDVLFDIAYLQDARSFDSAIRSLFLSSSRVDLVVFSRSWWCDSLSDLILYTEIVFPMMMLMEFSFWAPYVDFYDRSLDRIIKLKMLRILPVEEYLSPLK
jgi:hypothetical protein